MNLPNRQRAYILRAKLTAYLLSETHAVGKSKAKFFRALGFEEITIDLLEQRLVRIAQTEPITETISSQHGTKYIIEGDLQAITGPSRRIRTVWIVELGEDRPRFVTAYPV
ncbi:MAG TPA: hypothetical protein VGD99_16835 [Anaerolineae bacterium]|jgi:hypothetical protein